MRAVFPGPPRRFSISFLSCDSELEKIVMLTSYLNAVLLAAPHSAAGTDLLLRF